MRLTTVGEEATTKIRAEKPVASFDLVNMNPPFTLNLTCEGAYAGTIAAALTGLDSCDADQTQMANRMESLKKNTCYRGNAEIASAFAALVLRKIKTGGVRGRGLEVGPYGDTPPI